MHLDACHRLRNQLVIDRLHNRLMNKARKKLGLTTHYLNRALQYDTVKKYAREDTGLSLVHSQVRQNVAVRVDEGYKQARVPLQGSAECTKWYWREQPELHMRRVSPQDPF